MAAPIAEPELSLHSSDHLLGSLSSDDCRYSPRLVEKMKQKREWMGLSAGELAETVYHSKEVNVMLEKMIHDASRESSFDGW